MCVGAPVRAPAGGDNGVTTSTYVQNVVYKTKYKLYTTSLNILKCCNTFKTFHIQLGIIQLSRGEPLLQLNNLYIRRVRTRIYYTNCTNCLQSSCDWCYEKTLIIRY